MKMATTDNNKKVILKLWNKYKNYVRTVNQNENFDLERSVISFVKTLPILPSSRRTYLHYLLGRMGRSPRWRALDEGRVLRPGLRLREFYRETQAVSPKQSRPADIQQLLYGPIPNDLRTHLLLCFLLAARLGDYVANLNSLKWDGKILSIFLRSHKTVGTIGPKTISVEVDRAIAPFVALPVQPTSQATLAAALKTIHLTQHSLRRGAVAYYDQKGWPPSAIRSLTLHTHPTSFLRYLSTVTGRVYE